VPNLVETVKGAAKFEKDTFTAVTEARAKVGQVQGNTSPNDAASVEKFRAAQDQLSSALSKLMVEAMDGSLEVTSVVGKGSTFTVELPPALVLADDAQALVRASR